jgi:hypothetical protein
MFLSAIVNIRCLCKKRKKKRVEKIKESREAARWENGVITRAPLDNDNLRRFWN